jgi:hypothetical protein
MILLQSDLSIGPGQINNYKLMKIRRINIVELNKFGFL